MHSFYRKRFKKSNRSIISIIAIIADLNILQVQTHYKSYVPITTYYYYY